ncbi:MAG: ABC transporter permease subunit [Microthrixaceae bacterium]
MSSSGIVFAKTLADQRRGLIGWGAGVSGTVFIMSAMWPSFSDIDFDAIMAQYPKGLMEVFNVADMSNAIGFLNAEVFSLMLPIMFAVYAIGRGARLIGAEEEDGTLEVLASMPISRRAMLVEKAGGLVVGVTLLGVSLLAGTVASSALFGLDIGLLDSVNGAVAMTLLGAEFGLAALAVSAATGRRGLAVGVVSGLAGASYLMYVAGQLLDSLKPLVKFSPFYQAISGGPLAPTLPPTVLAMPAVGLVVFVASIPLFQRRDLVL